MGKNKLIKPHLYAFSLWGGIFILIIGLLLSTKRESEAVGIIMVLFGIAAMIYAEIYFLISLYRCWFILQGSTARTTPGMAVGFLFIPIFNFYWIFVAIRGLAKDANAFLESKNVHENKISIRLSLATCIVAIIPSINSLDSILKSILIYKWANFFNYSVTNLGVKIATKKIQTRSILI